MPKRCVNCGSVWTLDLARCAFCGGPAVDQPVPPPVELEPPRRRAAAPGGAPGRAAPPPPPASDPAGRGLPAADFFGAPPDFPTLTGLAAILVCGILPATVLLSGHRGLALAACGLLLPLPSFAWLAGLRAETQGRLAGLPLPDAAPVVKTLALIALAVLLGQAAILAALVIFA